MSEILFDPNWFKPSGKASQVTIPQSLLEEIGSDGWRIEDSVLRLAKKWNEKYKPYGKKDVVNITLDETEIDQARNNEWDWIKQKIVALLPPEPPVWAPNMEIEMRNWDSADWRPVKILVAGPDTADPTKVVLQAATGTTEMPVVDLNKNFTQGLVRLAEPF